MRKPLKLKQQLWVRCFTGKKAHYAGKGGNEPPWLFASEEDALAVGERVTGVIAIPVLVTIVEQSTGDSNE